MRTAAYTSTATLLFTDGSAPVTKTTVMNAPIVHRGLYLFQGSPLAESTDALGQPLAAGMAFTAATDPGLTVKYIGSAILVLGILLMYLLRFLPVRRPAPAKA